MAVVPATAFLLPMGLAITLVKVIHSLPLYVAQKLNLSVQEGAKMDY